MTTVLVTHNHPAVRTWSRGALARAQDIEFVVEVGRGEEAWHLIQQLRWDVVLIACSLPCAPGAAEIAEWAQIAGIDLHLLVLETPDHDGLLCRLWRAGALGCLPEETTPDAIVHAVQVAAEGTSLWTADQVAQAQRWWDAVGAKLEALTERERQVLGLIAGGLTNRQIAERLVLSKGTVETHVHHVLRKLVARNRVEVAMVLAKALDTNQATPENQ